MFDNQELKDYFENQFSISLKSAVVAEWNMNVPNNIFKLGNYRYRPTGSKFNALPNSFDRTDIGNFYSNANDSDVAVLINNTLLLQRTVKNLVELIKDIQYWLVASLYCKKYLGYKKAFS